MLSKSRLTIVFGASLIFIGLIIVAYQNSQLPAGVIVNSWGTYLAVVGIIILGFGAVWKFVSKD